MKDIKKLMITLVALLAVTTGAWADGIVCTASDLGKVLCTDGSIYENVSAATTAGKTAVAMIAYVDETNKNGLAIQLNASPESKNWNDAMTYASGLTAVPGGTWRLPSKADWQNMFVGCAKSGDAGASDMMNPIAGFQEKIGATGITWKSDNYWTSTSSGSKAWRVTVLLFDSDTQAGFGELDTSNSRCVLACLAFDIASAPSGPEVAWDKAAKTSTFTMPGGNVTLEPEYYPQATVADGGVTAADADARATTDDPLVKVDATKLTGAKKLMYFVSNSGTTAPAYDAEGWTDQLPTAEGFTQQGIVYVWYYPVGTDEGVDGATATYSDGDICLKSITARIAAAPTYAVTFAEGTDANEWTADPATDVTKGQTVTVTYTGSKKVIGVKAEKKAAAPAKPLANATAEDLGKIAGADGNIYDTKAAAEAANTTAVAMIAYVGSASDCTHGLAIALADESGTKTWSEAGAACSGKTAVTGGTWRLPSIKDWQYMFIGCGASGSYSDSPSTMSYSELATKLTTANGTALQTVSYWSSTESSPGEDAWSLYFGGSSASFFSGDYEGDYYPIRACLVF